MSKHLRPLIAVGVLLFTMGFNQSVFAQLPPGDAGETTEALANAAVAGVVSISGGVEGETVDTYSEAISLLIEGKSIRLLTDNIDEALGGNNSKARGNVEKTLLEAVLLGSGITWLPDGNDAVTIFPLADNTHPNCVTCHINFSNPPTGTIIGGLLIRVPMGN